tara:strand:- start:276 stop:677 length:402 start_codon:yes stop_codon:yes gene_type:complete
MKFSEIELPSNKKFGFFFTTIFFIIGVYLINEGIANYSYYFFGVSILFFLVTLVKASLLHPLNKLWMMLGVLLGMIVGPVVLGIIFFGLFTPISFFMKLFKRDELRLKLKSHQSHWKVPNTDATESESFKYQF